MASTQKARTIPIVHKTIESLKELYKKNPVLFVLACIGVGIAAIAIGFFFVLILISFIALPVNNRSGGYQANSFGSYNGKTIEYRTDNYFGRMVYYYAQQQKNQNNPDNKNANYFLQYQIWRQAFEQTVSHMGKLDEARSAGLTVSKSRLNRETLKQSQFLDESGKFSLKLYRAATDSERAAAWKTLQDGLVEQEYDKIVVGSADPKNLVQYIKDANRDERGFTFVSFPFSVFPDSEIKAFGQKNAKLFRSIKVSYIQVDKSKPLADKLYKSISSGSQKFSEAIAAAKNNEYSGFASSDRSYWEVKEGFTDEKDAEAVFALQKGAFSPLMKTKDDQWVFFRCEEPAVEPDFSRLELTSKVWSYIQTKEKSVIEAYCSKRAEEFSAKAKNGFDAACKEFNVTAKKLDPFPINYGSFPLILNQPVVDKYPELAGISNNESFLTAAFSLKKGELSKPLVVTDAVTVLRFDEEKTVDPNGLALIDYYYYQYSSNYMSEQLGSYFMKSPKFFDDFGREFQKAVMPNS